MHIDARSIRISATFAKWMETRQSSRYRFQNKDRGDDQFVIIQWTHHGSGAVTYEGRTYSTGPDEAFILMVPEPSAYFYPPETEIPWCFSWINFYGNISTEICRRFRAIHGPVLPLHRHGTAGQALASLIRETARRIPHDDYERSAASYAFLMAWARELEHPPQRRRNPVATAAEICRTRFREPLGIKQLADAAGVTREHLTREFLRTMKTSPAQYLRDLRVQAARQMLEDHGSTLTETALRCGFPSAKAMNRAFSRIAK